MTHTQQQQIVLKDYKFVLCVDPQSSLYYSINLQTYDIHIQQFSDKKKQQLFRQKSRKACQQLRKIISWARLGYLQSQQVWRYRRRKLPDYLLQQVKSQLPAYIIQQPLPVALAQFNSFGKLDDNKSHKNMIQIEVLLHEYMDIIKLKQPFRSDPIIEIDSLNIKLVTSVSEVIKIILKEISRKYIQIYPFKAENKFILKVAGNQDYWYGNTPIMNYAYIRKCLRNREKAIVILTQKKIIQSHQFRKAVFYRNRNQVNRGNYQEFNWEILQNQELLLWYPPFPLDKQHIKEIQLKQQLLAKLQNQKVKFIQSKKQNPFNVQSAQIQQLKLMIKKLQVDFQRPRFIMKENTLANCQTRRTQTQKKVVTVKQDCLCTGECQYAFEFKILGINSLLRIFYLHPKYIKQLQNSQKSLLISHSVFNNQLLNNIKKYGFLNFIPYYCSIRVMLTYGQQILKQYKTQNVIISNNVKFQQKFFYYTLSTLPMQTKLFFQIKVWPRERNNSQKLGCCGFSIFDQKGYLKQGLIQLNIYPFKTVDLRIAGCINDYQVALEHIKNYIKLYVQLPKYNQKIIWSLRDSQTLQNLGYKLIQDIGYKYQEHYYKIEGRQKLDTLLKADPLRMMQYTQKQKQILRVCKADYSKLPQRYINYLYSLNWSSPDHTGLGLKSLSQWVQLPPKCCFALLSPKIIDQSIRFHATQRFVELTDDELILYMLQLVQSLVVQSNHHNPLSQLLLQKSIKNPYHVGHLFFWQLKSQLEKDFVFQRYALYLECLSMLSINRNQLIDQIKVNELLIQLNMKIIEEGKDSEAKNQYFATKGLQFLRKQLPNYFILSINPQKKNRDFVQSGCKVLDSKKIPLFITTIQNKKQQYNKRKVSLSPVVMSKFDFLSKNKKESSSQRYQIYSANKIQQRIIFKCGDDLRQDQLTLQLLKVMDNIWLQAGYDFKMSIYRVLPIGNMVGYIEVVENSETNSKIHKQYGGNTGALDNQTTEAYLRKHNPDQSQYQRAKDNFIKSSVGYLVSTYVLGIGDRHSGNVMISKNGLFFHIDFGHFLGNFKEKFNIKRQRSPFLFTSQYVHVMGGRDTRFFKQFESLCGIAYNLLRQNSSFLINLFILMVPNGIPQLNTYSDIQYMVDKLSLNLSNNEADQKIKKQIAGTLEKETSRRLDNFVHQIKRTG